MTLRFIDIKTSEPQNSEVMIKLAVFLAGGGADT
jgi:hypothetical protein